MRSRPIQHVAARAKHMATTFEFTISCEEQRVTVAKQVLSRCHERVAEIENELTEFRAMSPIFQFNTMPVGTEIRVSKQSLDLIERAVSLSILTEGSFQLLSKSSIPVENLSSFDRWINIDRQRSSITKLDKRVHLGFGAIGKGFALDCVRKELEKEGFENFRLVSGGSSIVFSGFSAPGVPWQWGWAWKKDENGEWMGEFLSHDSGKTIALGISGLQEQGEHIRGRRAEVLSALVAHESAEVADALSTALFVAGWAQSKKWFTDMLIVPAAAVIDQAEYPFWNERFQELWGEFAESENETSKKGSIQSSVAMGVATFTLFLIDIWNSTHSFAQETVDLEDFGLDEFTPYLYERDPYWLLLPIAMLLFIVWHLRQYRPAVKTIGRPNRRESDFSSAKKQSLKELVGNVEKKVGGTKKEN